MHNEPPNNDENDDIYRSLFNNIQSGVAYCRMLFDGGKPVDFVYLMVNDAFAEQTGMKDVVGKKVSEVAQSIIRTNPELFDRYARTSLTGKSDRFEIFVEPLGKWFAVSVHSPKPEHFIAVLDNITERKAAQDALEEQERLLQQFIERAPAAIAMFDKDMRYLAVSQRFIQEYRLDDSNLIGRSHYDVFPEIPERWREFHRRGMAGETIRCEEDPFLRQDGKTDWLRWEITPWFSGQEVGGILMFTESITERKEVEEKLKGSEERYRTLFINMTEGFALGEAVLDETGQPVDFRFLEINESFVQQTGLSHKVVGKTFTEVFPQIEQAWFERYSHVVLTGEPVRFIEYNADTRRYYDLYAYRPLPERFAVVFRDVTRQHQAEEALRESENRFRHLADAMPQLVWTAEPDGTVDYYNERYHEYTGFSRKENGEYVWAPALHPDDVELTVQAWKHAVETGDVYQVEHRVHLIDGSYRWHISRAFPAHDKQGKILKWFGTSTDIHDLKTAQEALAESEGRFRELYEKAPLPYQSLDIEGNLLEVNEKWLSMLGYEREEVIGHFFGDFITEASVMQPVDEFPRFKALGRIEGGPFEMVCKNGSHRLWVVNGQIARDRDGNFLRTHCIFTDVTERQKTEEQLRLAAMVYQDSSEGMMVTDADNVIVAVNPAFEQITGYQADEVIGKRPGILRSGRQGKEFYQAMWESINATGRWKGEIWNRAKNGEEYIEQITINTSYNPDGSILRRVALFSDITEKKQSEDLIWTQANFDTLTGLPNRRFFRDHLQQEIRKSRRTKQPLALLLMDLDGFKEVNDTLGHEMGDVLLKEAAERLRGCVRDIDTVARLGGDEFTIILTELHDPSNADRVARHILENLSSPFMLDEELAYVSASIGITLYPNDAAEPEELIRNADQAMYEAKQRGKNQYQYFTPAMQKAAVKRMRLVNDMRKALERNQFKILYQPIVELSTGCIRKAEALIRWDHPTRGLINPIEFISAAEDTGMISAFGDWIFHEAAKEAAFWREKYHPDLQISVNISPIQFKREGIDPGIWFEHLKNLGLPGQGIVVEITEGLLLDTSAKVTDQLLMLRDAGIEVALDDFGTGYSSLSYLKRFDIDYIKIDQAFVQNLASGSDDLALCEAIIVMAHKLGIKVIAEGIETTEQCRLLIAAGCDYGQGYLFSRPGSPEEIQLMLDKTLNAF